MELTTEQIIIQAARKEFIETGLAGARMQKIAERAGVNKALLHYYFRSKEKLYEASFKDSAFTFWDAIEKQIPEIENSGNLRILIQTVVATFFRVMSANPDFPKMIIREIADGASIIQVLGNTVYNRFSTLLPRVQKIIREEVVQGNVYPFEPFHLLLNIAGMCAISVMIEPVVNVVSAMVGKTIHFDDTYYQKRIGSIVELISHGIYKQEM
jgi:AcrR family transcriptional regulator